MTRTYAGVSDSARNEHRLIRGCRCGPEQIGGTAVRPECGRSTSAQFLLPAFVITELRKSLRPEANFGMGPAKREAGSNFSSVARGESPVTSVQFTTEPGQARIAARP